MEFYVFIGCVIAYILSTLIKKKEAVRRFWMVAYLVAFLVTSVCIIALNIGDRELMTTISNMGWYYLTYICAIAMIILGFINFWMLRKTIWNILWKEPVPAEDCPLEAQIKNVDKTL